MSVALIIVDYQIDFIEGSLAVPGADSSALESYIESFAILAKDMKWPVYLTRDWHPAEMSPHFDMWPAHCIADTPGAAIQKRIELYSDATFSKGTDPHSDGYSGFDGVADELHLDSALRARNITSLIVCGLALDYCVGSTAIDAVDRGYQVVVPVAATASVSPQGEIEAIETLRHRGVVVLA